MHMSSTTIMGVNDITGQQEFRPRSPSTMLPVAPKLKEALDKFEKVFQVYKTPLLPLQSGTNWVNPALRTNYRN